MGRWDICLKLLLRECTQEVLNWILPGAVFIGWRDGQFQMEGRGPEQQPSFVGVLAHEIRADSMMEVEYQGRRYLIHVEFQSTKDDEIGYRLLGYSHAAVGLHELPVLSFVIYVLKVSPPPSSPYEWPGTGGEVQMSFKYRSIELAEIPVEELEQKNLVGLAPLLLLAKDGATRAVLERAITVLEQARRPEALAILRLLAPHVFENNQEMVTWIERRFTLMHDFLLEESIMYKELVKEGEIKGREEGIGIGREEGREEGIGIGQRRSIEAVVRAHFPDLLDLARERVARVHDEQQLDNILLQLIAISAEAEAHRFLMTLPAK